MTKARHKAQVQCARQHQQAAQDQGGGGKTDEWLHICDSPLKTEYDK